MTKLKFLVVYLNLFIFFFFLQLMGIFLYRAKSVLSLLFDRFNLASHCLVLGAAF